MGRAAKTNRSTCKGCKRKIAKNALRLGVPYDYDGHLSFSWHHPKCVTSECNYDDICGLEDISPEDQEKLKALKPAQKTLRTVAPVAAAPYGFLDNGKKRLTPFSVECLRLRATSSDFVLWYGRYAASGNSNCKACSEALARNEVRIGYTCKDADTSKECGYYGAL